MPDIYALIWSIVWLDDSQMRVWHLGSLTLHLVRLFVLFFPPLISGCWVSEWLFAERRLPMPRKWWLRITAAPRQWQRITRTITTSCPISIHPPTSTTINTRASITSNTPARPPPCTQYSSTPLRPLLLPPRRRWCWTRASSNRTSPRPLLDKLRGQRPLQPQRKFKPPPRPPWRCIITTTRITYNSWI